MADVVLFSEPGSAEYPDIALDYRACTDFDIGLNDGMGPDLYRVVYLGRRMDYGGLIFFHLKKQNNQYGSGDRGGNQIILSGHFLMRKFLSRYFLESF